MKNEILHNLNKFVTLDQGEFDHFYSSLVLKELKKGEHLFYAGNICRDVYFIVNGCLMYYYSVNGEQKIGQFFFEGTWIGDLYSFLSKNPSKMNVSAIEPSSLLALSYENMQKLYVEIPKLERFGRLLIEQTFIHSQQRSASFLTKSPTEKYLTLVKSRPKVVSRVPQYMIASFLGIKPESLSRIRKKLAKNKDDLPS